MNVGDLRKQRRRECVSDECERVRLLVAKFRVGSAGFWVSSGVSLGDEGGVSSAECGRLTSGGLL